MKFNYLLQFFKDGFSLANHSLEIYLIQILISSFTFLDLFFPNIGELGIYRLSFLFTLLLSSAFALSLPVFLVWKQQGKKINFKELFSITLKNAKRIILPGLLIFVLVVIFAILFFGIIAIFIFPGPDQMRVFIENHIQGWRLAFLLISILLAIFEFSAFYFSLENKSLFKAMRMSVAAAFRNLHYIACIALANTVNFILASSVPLDFKLGQFGITIINLYISFIITASSLLYYQKVINKSQARHYPIVDIFLSK